MLKLVCMNSSQKFRKLLFQKQPAAMFCSEVQIFILYPCMVPTVYLILYVCVTSLKENRSTVLKISNTLINFNITSDG